jgi:hypothetical protein
MFSVARRPVSFIIVLSVVLSTLAVLIPSLTKVVEAAPRTKFTICHRTNAITNPYRRITVAWSSVNDDGNGHDNPSHDGPVFNIANPSASHGTLPRDSGLGLEAGGGNDRWGDIFNVSRTTGPQNDRSNSKNWTTEGQAIFNGATFTYNGVTKQACRLMTAQEHLASEIPALLANEAAKPSGRRTDAQVIAEVMVELDEMGAAEDTALKQGLTGGSFSSWYAACTTNCTDPNTLTTTLNSIPQPSVTTTTPTVTSTTTATLTGTITPLGASMLWYFELSPTNDFADSNVLIENKPSTPQGPSSVQGPASVTNNVTGLVAGTTYYYRTVGIVASGSNDAAVESFYYGQVEQFTTPGLPSATTDPASSVTETTATLNGTGTSNGASSTVTFTWGTTPGLTSGNNTVTVPQSPLGSSAAGSAVTAALTGLTGGTTYFFRTNIQNANGSATGIIRQFTTNPTPNAPSSSPTTVAPPATTPTNSSSVSTGAVEGTAWIDADLDERKDAVEAWLAGITVTLTSRSNASQTSTATTDANGAFSFSSVTPGTYTLRADLPQNLGLERSWDSSGNDDWSISITVESAKTTRGDFAAVGSAIATGTVAGGGGGTVEIVWNGIDDQPNTPDDATFTTNIATSEEFAVNGLPLGKFAVSARSRTGRGLVSSASLRITTSGATLNSGALRMNVRIVDVLPQTGAPGLSLPMGFAAMLIPVGIAATGLVRRRRR